MRSLPGCMQQLFHYDYDPVPLRHLRSSKKPLGVLLAIQDNTKLVTLKGEVVLASGDVFIFEGDVVHAGGLPLRNTACATCC